MSLRSFLLTTFFFVLATLLHAQKTKTCVLKGTASFAKGCELRVALYNDYVSLHKKIAGKTTVATDGTFEIELPINGIQIAEVKIKTAVNEFLLIPGRTYNLQITMDSLAFQMLTPAAAGEYLNIKNSEVDTNDLNYKINSFSNYYQQILDFYQYEIFHKREVTYLDTVQYYLTEKFPLENNPTNYYLSYIFYTLGTLEYFYYNTSPLIIYNKYFNSEYILYDNPAYMLLFNQFYNNYLYGSPYISKQLIEDAINEDADYVKLFNEVGSDPLLANQRLRELVIIKNLGELLNSPYYNSNNIVTMLLQLKENTHFKEHVTIVEGILAKPDVTLVGANLEFPTMQLPNGNKWKAKTIKDKYTYFYFFNTDCIDCIRNFLILEEIHKQLQDSLNVVAVSIDFEYEKFQRFTERYQNFTFPIVHFSQNFDWLETLEVRTLPDFFLLTPEGTMGQRYLPPPDQGLIIKLLQLFKKAEEDDNNPMYYQRNSE